MKKSITLCMLVFCSLSLLAQKNIYKNIVAHIVDEEGEPIPFVIVASIHSEVYLTAVESDVSGIFDIDMTPKTSLQFFAIGYETITIPYDKIVNEDLVILPSKSYNLDVVVVTAQKKYISCKGGCCYGFCTPDNVRKKINPIPEEPYEWNYYPNPTYGEVFIETENRVGMISVYDLLGKRLFTKSINNSLLELNLEHLPSSTYFLTYEKDGESQNIGKVIKLKD